MYKLNKVFSIINHITSFLKENVEMPNPWRMLHCSKYFKLKFLQHNRKFAKKHNTVESCITDNYVRQTLGSVPLMKFRKSKCR